jgi:hypothetical protein
MYNNKRIFHASSIKHSVKDSRFRLHNNIRRLPNKRDRRLAEILDAIEYDRSSDKDFVPAVPLAKDPLIPLIESVVKAADKRKASSISVFRVHDLTEVTTFMVLIEGNSKPQNQAISLAIEVSL